MKKTKSFLPILLAMGTLATLASCGAKTECPTCSSCETCGDVEPTTPTHTHTKTETYSYDENGHYHECSGCKENVRFDYEEHSFVEKDGINICSVCGYVENQDMEEFFKTFKKAIEAYEADKTQTTEVIYNESEKENGIYKYGYEATSKVSFDLERNLYFAEGVDIDTGYDEEGNVEDKETTKEGAAYIKNGDTYSYYKHSGDEKEMFKTDAHMIQNRFNKNYLMTDYFSPLEYSYLANFADYEKVFNKYYTSYGYDYISINHSLKSIDGGYEYKIDIELRDAYTSQLGIYTENFAITIKNDSFVSLIYASDRKYTYIDETTIAEEYIYSYDISVSYDFDQTSYDAFDKTGYEDNGNGEEFDCTYYYEDYEIGNSVTLTIGETLASTTYVGGMVTYGDIYYDKEFTKKYNGEAITGNMDKMYVKPTVKEGSYAKIVLLSEKTYIDADGIEENRVYSKWSSGRDVEVTEGQTNSFSVTYEEFSGRKTGKYYVNGELLEGDKFEIEAGKIYIVEYKRNCYQ